LAAIAELELRLAELVEYSRMATTGKLAIKAAADRENTLPAELITELTTTI